MGNAIGQTLSLAVGVALSPVPIIAVILMLVTPRARSNGPAFVVGWLVGLAIVGTVVLLVAGPANANDEGEPATWVDVLELVLGLLLVLRQTPELRGHELKVGERVPGFGGADQFQCLFELPDGGVEIL